VLETDNYVRFEWVSSVAETDRGLLAELHDEQLRIDLIRDDLVRFKISRARHFDESPTFAVCADPLENPVEFRVELDAEHVRHGGQLGAAAVSAGRPPQRRHGGDRDGG
jgi:alpha-glucosidase